MIVSELLSQLSIIQATGDITPKTVTGVFSDSRQVIPGSVFIAIKGYSTDGHNYLMNVFNDKNPSAIIVENPAGIPDEIFRRSGITKVHVADSRKALAQASIAYYGDPSSKLLMIGVTGTKGKTTSTYLIKQILESAGYKTGLIGTNVNIIGEKVIPSTHTTPESNELNKMLSEMVNAGCKACVMEVSSHSLFLKRTYGLKFDVAVFTNLSSEHRDFHETMDDYAAAKKILFDSLGENATAVINADDQYSDFVIKDCKAKVVRFGTGENNDIIMSNPSIDFEGTFVNLKHNGKEFEVSTSLKGAFNTYNTTCAFGACLALGIEPKNIIESIKKTEQVPGRFEVVSNKEKRVVIDYAHSPAALEQLLESVKKISGTSQIYTVFGCGGNRDKIKRPVMGEIASRFSDHTIVTSDNPRDEEPLAIIDEIVEGIKSDSFSIIPDREEAIANAVLHSPADAIVVIAGKGSEDYQIIKGVKNRFLDKEKAEYYLSQI